MILSSGFVLIYQAAEKCFFSKTEVRYKALLSSEEWPKVGSRRSEGEPDGCFRVLGSLRWRFRTVWTHYSSDVALGYCRRQILRAHQAVGGCGQDEHPTYQLEPLMSQLPHSARRLHETNDLFYALAFLLAGLITRM